MRVPIEGGEGVSSEKGRAGMGRALSQSVASVYSLVGNSSCSGARKPLSLRITRRPKTGVSSLVKGCGWLTKMLLFSRPGESAIQPTRGALSNLSMPGCAILQRKLLPLRRQSVLPLIKAALSRVRSQTPKETRRARPFSAVAGLAL